MFPWACKLSLIFYAFLALEDGKLLEISIAFLVVQKLITHWPQIVAYVSNTGQMSFSWLKDDCVYFLFMWDRLLIVNASSICVLERAFDNQVTGYPFFEALLEPLKMIVQDRREAFKRSNMPARHQDFFYVAGCVTFYIDY